LDDSWAAKPPEISSGEPITRTLTLRAEGATVGVLPEINAGAPVSGDVKQYPDQPSLHEERRSDGVLSRRQEKIALIASQPGSYRMPAVEIPWWNTRTQRVEVARLPERILTVLPSAHSQSQEAPQSPPEAASPPSEPVPALPSETGPPPRIEPSNGNLWFWLALLFGLGWLATAVAWWLSRRQPRLRVSAPQSGEPSSEQRLIARIEAACRSNDSAAAKRALTTWATARWPGAGPAELARRGSADLGREIGLLNRALYSPDSIQWRGDGLWQSFRNFLTTDRTSEKPSAAALEPLYKP
jgi:hypothetical protein